MYGANAGTPQQSYDSLPPPSVTGRPGGHNPYEFIVNPNTPGNARGSSQNKKFFMIIAFVVGGAALLMGIAALVISMTAPKGSTTGLKQIAQRQQELIRISKLSADSTTGSDTKNFVITVEYATISSQKDMVTLLNKQKVKLPPKELALYKDTKTDALLSDAAAAGTYDSTVAKVLTDQLETYENLVKSTYKDTTSKSTKAALQSTYDGAVALVKQGKALSGTTVDQ
jgi:hypothetical protein